MHRDIVWLISAAALLGSGLGHADDLGFAMAMIVVGFDTLFSFAAAAYVYDDRANWPSLGVRTLARTAVEILRWGFVQTL